MPAKSKKQLKWAYAAAHGDIKGVMPSVGQEMIDKTPEDKKSKLMKMFSKLKSKRK